MRHPHEPTSRLATSTLPQILRSALVVVALAVAAAALPRGALLAQTKYPNVDSVFPLAVTRGKVSEVELRFGGNVRTAHLALVEGEGIGAEVVARSEERKIPDDRAVVRLDVAPDAALGPRDIRLVTEEAITTLGRIHVTDLETTAEAAAHATPEEAQPIELPLAVNGRIERAVEIDWYRFEGRQGERVTFEVIGTRLHDTIQKIGRFTPHFDAFLAVTDAGGRELAVNDDHYFADPFLSLVLPADGEYRLAVREANYKGHASYTYVLVATRGPRATLTFPLAAPPGRETEVELVGPGIGAGERATVTMAADAVPGRVELVRPLLAEGAEAREVPVLAARLPVVVEAEGIEDPENDEPGGAQPVELPAGIAGRLARPDDADCFVFEVKKDVTYRFELFARRLFSALDGELEVVREDGRGLASADDSRDLAGATSRDPLLEWKAPADGRYVVRVRDLHRRGGPGFLYHLECAASEPDFELTFDPELAMVGPGNRTPIYVRAHRRGGLDGEIALEVEGLPEGVEAIAPPIRAGMNDACVVLSVAAEAPRGGSIFRIRGRATVAGEGGARVPLIREASPLIEIYQAQRVVGRTAAVAVTHPSDIEVTSEVEEVVLSPGETKVIPITIVRGEQYRSGSVSLWGMWRFGNRIFGNSLPPGVVVDEKQSRTGIIGENVEGAIALRAERNAKPIEKVQTVVIGLIPIEFSVFVPYCTRPILVTVKADEAEAAAGGG